MKIKVYTTPTCPWCKKVKAFLVDNNIEYEEIDVTGDEAAIKEMVEKSGQIGVPVTDVDGVIVEGFDEERLREVLKL
jgi:glutaredoxin-like YruB-family protein